jgi:hypothetical protein
MDNGAKKCRKNNNTTLTNLTQQRIKIQKYLKLNNIGMIKTSWPSEGQAPTGKYARQVGGKTQRGLGW